MLTTNYEWNWYSMLWRMVPISFQFKFFKLGNTKWFLEKLEQPVQSKMEEFLSLEKTEELLIGLSAKLAKNNLRTTIYKPYYVDFKAKYVPQFEKRCPKNDWKTIQIPLPQFKLKQECKTSNVSSARVQDKGRPKLCRGLSCVVSAHTVGKFDSSEYETLQCFGGSIELFGTCFWDRAVSSQVFTDGIDAHLLLFLKISSVARRQLHSIHIGTPQKTTLLKRLKVILDINQTRSLNSTYYTSLFFGRFIGALRIN